MIEEILCLVKTCYEKSEFDKLYRELNEKIPKFLHHNEILKYTIFKFILFDKIRIGEKITENKNFYEQNIIKINKKLNKQNWATINNNFMTIIHNPSIIRNYEYLIKLHEVFDIFFNLFKLELSNFINIGTLNENKQTEKEEYEFLLNFEYEIFRKDFKKIVPNKEINRKEVDQRRKDLINLNFKCTFNPGYTKRLNIDKKIIRRFRTFLKVEFKKLNKETITNQSFWNHFIENSFSPPFRFYEYNRQIEFKSYNTLYLIWLFTHENSSMLYTEFLNKIGEEFSQSLIKKFNLNDNNEKEELIFYFYHFHNIYSKSNNTYNCLTETLSDVTTNETFENIYKTYLGNNYLESEINEDDIFNKIDKDFKNNLNSRLKYRRINRSLDNEVNSQPNEKSRGNNINDSWSDYSSDKEE